MDNSPKPDRWRDRPAPKAGAMIHASDPDGLETITVLQQTPTQDAAFRLAETISLEHGARNFMSRKGDYFRCARA
jgi:hypothetical protein